MINLEELKPLQPGQVANFWKNVEESPLLNTYLKSNINSLKHILKPNEVSEFFKENNLNNNQFLLEFKKLWQQHTEAAGAEIQQSETNKEETTGKKEGEKNKQEEHPHPEHPAEPHEEKTTEEAEKEATTKEEAETEKNKTPENTPVATEANKKTPEIAQSKQTSTPQQIQTMQIPTQEEQIIEFTQQPGQPSSQNKTFTPIFIPQSSQPSESGSQQIIQMPTGEFGSQIGGVPSGSIGAESSMSSGDSSQGDEQSAPSNSYSPGETPTQKSIPPSENRKRQGSNPIGDEVKKRARENLQKRMGLKNPLAKGAREAGQKALQNLGKKGLQAAARAAPAVIEFLVSNPVGWAILIALGVLVLLALIILIIVIIVGYVQSKSTDQTASLAAASSITNAATIITDHLHTSCWLPGGVETNEDYDQLAPKTINIGTYTIQPRSASGTDLCASYNPPHILINYPREVCTDLVIDSYNAALDPTIQQGTSNGLGMTDLIGCVDSATNGMKDFFSSNNAKGYFYYNFNNNSDINDKNILQNKVIPGFVIFFTGDPGPNSCDRPGSNLIHVGIVQAITWTDQTNGNGKLTTYEANNLVKYGTYPINNWKFTTTGVGGFGGFLGKIPLPTISPATGGTP